VPPTLGEVRGMRFEGLVDSKSTQQYNCVVIPDFDEQRNLPPGIHEASWEEFVDRFGYTGHRLRLIAGLQRVITHLREAGCRRIYVDGSFVTAKQAPGDFDCCWDPRGVNTDQLKLLHPTILNTRQPRVAQKAIYKGDIFPTNGIAEPIKKTYYLDFFQRDKRTGRPKGIVALDTGDVHDNE
jgi:hypothetical protein